MNARVLVVKTNLVPENKGFLHLVMLANGKARIGNELDQWRLFDLQNNSVTFVDDIGRTFRTESLTSLLQQKRTALQRELPQLVPSAEFAATPHERTFGDFPARLYLIRMGGYQRSLWMSTTLNVPAQLFPLMVASDPLSTPYSPAMAEVFEGMVALGGYPVIDRSDVVYAGEARMIEKRVIKVENRRLPAAWFRVPDGYRDLGPAAAR